MGDDYDYPPDDSDRTWHLHDDDTWGWGVRCAECRLPQEGSKYAHTLPRFAIEIFKRQNREGRTTSEEVREVLSNVKPENRDKIARAR